MIITLDCHEKCSDYNIDYLNQKKGYTVTFTQGNQHKLFENNIFLSFFVLISKLIECSLHDKCCYAQTFIQLGKFEHTFDSNRAQEMALNVKKLEAICSRYEDGGGLINSNKNHKRLKIYSSA